MTFATTLLQRFGNDGQPLIPASIRDEETKKEPLDDNTGFSLFVIYGFLLITILQIIGILMADRFPVQVKLLFKKKVFEIIFKSLFR